MTSDYQKQRRELVERFNPVVNILIEILKKKSGMDRVNLTNIDRLKKRISLLKSLDTPEALIRDSAEFFLDYSDRILMSDEAYFEALDVRKAVTDAGRPITAEDEFVFELVALIKTINKTTNDEEKKVVWAYVKTLHDAACEYLLIPKD